MSETNIGSKTIWGFGVAFLIGGLQATGFVDASGVFANLVQYVGTLFGLWGARNALR